MKKLYYFILVVILFVGCAAISFQGSIRDFLNESLVERSIDQLSGFDFWQDSQRDYDDHLIPGAVVRRAIASDYAEAKDKEFWDVYEVVYEQLRKHFSEPEILWSEYLRLKPTILSLLRSQPEVVAKMKKVFDEDFLQHLEGQSFHKDYLSQRWQIMKEINYLRKEGLDWNIVPKKDLEQIQFENDIVQDKLIKMSDSESYRWQLDHNRFYLSFGYRNDDRIVESIENVRLICKLGVLQTSQENFGEYDYLWGYTSDISQKLGFAFDFRQRRISEGGERLADTWARVARDIMSHI